MQQTQQIHNEFKDVFSGISCLDDTFSLQVKADSKPQQALPRCMAYVLQKPFKQELEVATAITYNCTAVIQSIHVLRYTKIHMLIPAGTCSICITHIVPPPIHSTLVYTVMTVDISIYSKSC